MRGFLPASLVDIRRVQDLDEFMGQTLRCQVIELNRSRNNVVLSRRAVLEEERREMRQAILDRLSPGDVVEGTISNIVDFGAFVDLEGIDGLIHISELSWSHVNHPSELLEIGQEVRVKVLDIDRERQRISLGLKQTQTDPWQQVIDTYEQGDVVEGRVTKVVTFGAFVEVVPGVEGLVHISELATHHVENPREIVQQGETVRAKIIEMDAERRRLSLSLKRVEEGEAARPGIGDEATPELGLSEEVFAEEAAEPEAAGGPAVEPEAAEEPAVEDAVPEEQAVLEDEAVRRSRPFPRMRPSPRTRPSPRSRPSQRTRPSRTRPPRSLTTSSSSRPVAVAITGGIGAGKTEALRAFARHGAAVVSSDEIVHELLRVRSRGSAGGRGPARRRGRRRRRADRPREGRRDRLRRPAPRSRGSKGFSTRASSPATSAGATSWPSSSRRRRSASPRCRSSTRSAASRASTRWSSSRRRPRSASRDTSGRMRERELRLIPEGEKTARADFVYVNDGTLAELDAFVSDVMTTLSR